MLSDDVEPQAVSGRGTVYSYTINRQAWCPDLEVPFVLADGRARRAAGPAADDERRRLRPTRSTIGMAVEVAFVERGEAFIPVFHEVAA